MFLRLSSNLVITGTLCSNRLIHWNYFLHNSMLAFVLLALTLCGTTHGCEEGLYGPDCDKTCSATCEFGRCHSSTGRCRSCPPGRDGSQCNRDCKTGMFGHGCDKYCSRYCWSGSEACDPVDGACVNGCKAGYLPPLCVDTCPPGRYGINCTSDCIGNCLDGKCDHAYGYCDKCPEGKTGTRCLDDCPSGKYGMDCAEGCPPSCLNGLCHPITGQCEACPEGFKGISCNE
ncbi:hypothetical protein EGW08_014330, partial [Elysia chlorotica]